jgi:hypothetical protein
MLTQFAQSKGSQFGAIAASRPRIGAQRRDKRSRNAPIQSHRLSRSVMAVKGDYARVFSTEQLLSLLQFFTGREEKRNLRSKRAQEIPHLELPKVFRGAFGGSVVEIVFDGSIGATVD